MIHITAINIFIKISSRTILQFLHSQAPLLACYQGSVSQWCTVCSLSQSLPSALLDLLCCSTVKACLLSGGFLYSSGSLPKLLPFFTSYSSVSFSQYNLVSVSSHHRHALFLYFLKPVRQYVVFNLEHAPSQLSLEFI